MERPASCRAPRGGVDSPGEHAHVPGGKTQQGVLARAEAPLPALPRKRQPRGRVDGQRGIHTPALRGILPQWESEGLERGGACQAGQSPPREDPSRERREVWGPWAAGLAWRVLQSGWDWSPSHMGPWVGMCQACMCVPPCTCVPVGRMSVGACDSCAHWCPRKSLESVHWCKEYLYAW